jgi:hypothetical protein
MEVLNMAKKIIMGVLFLGLVGALTVGAVNRTVAKSEDTNRTEQRGAGWARAQEDGTALAANVEGRGGQGGGQGGGRQQTPASGDTRQANQHESLNSQAAGGQSSQGRGNSSQAGNAQRNPQELAAAEDHQWETVAGAVLSIDDTQMTVQTGGGEIVIADRPWAYALEAGFAAQVGDQVAVRGFYEGETFEAGQLTNGDLTVAIREDTGRPLWAGGGRWSGQGRSG